MKYIYQLLIQRDKQQHFIACFFISLFTLPFVSLVFSFTLAMAIGLLKEIWDHYYGSGFCWFDMQANVLGATAGTIVYCIFYILYIN